MEPIYITHPYHAPTYVYRIFTEDGLLLYIGSTRNLPNRLEDHRHTAWFSLAHRVETEAFDTDYAARVAESEAIARENPAANVVGTRRNCGRGASSVDQRLIERGIRVETRFI
ncbi:MAG: GIY-YIG nuclease family protein [Actinomycetota bacterium]